VHLIHRKTCRVCGSSALSKVIDMGVQKLQGSFFKPPSSMFAERAIPLSLVRCDPSRDEKACGLLQVEHSVPPELLYRLYWYRSGTNRTMQGHLRGIVEEACELRGGHCKTALDIGCNDGTLLSFYPGDTECVGIDPSNSLPASTDRVQYVRDFFPSVELRNALGPKKFEVITSVAMFYDLEDPLTFTNEVRHFLAPDGIWVVEVSYMPQMLKQGSYDSICHEHLEYYSLSTLENLFERAELKLVRADFNGMNGGSIRCFVTHQNCFEYKSDEDLMKLREIRVAEFDMELDLDRPYRLFQDGIERHRVELTRVLRDLRLAGKSIHIYGASTKGNTILQWCGIDSRLVDCASERNPDKWGTVTPGTEIPIVSEEESRARNPDCYLVLPWHFQEEFLQREEAMLRRGTRFIFPLPEVRVVGG
jgi:SAM-dependent methyltransferase